MRGSFFIAPVLAAALALGACNDDTIGGSNEGSRLRILLTDAPGDLAEAWVTIDEITFIRSDGERVGVTPDVTGFINLVNLANGTTLEIVNTDLVPVGTYTDVRVVLGDSYVVLSDGRVFATQGADLPDGVTADGTLRCPSCSSSGFKVKFNGAGLEFVEDATFVLDFDVNQSFGHEAGKSGAWVVHPVLRVDATTIRFGVIRGTVSLATGVTLPACGGGPTALPLFTPMATRDGNTFTAPVDSSGNFRIARLLPGTYTIGFAPDVTFTNGDSLTFAATPSAESVVVAEADSATANFSITAATCH